MQPIERYGVVALVFLVVTVVAVLMWDDDGKSPVRAADASSPAQATASPAGTSLVAMPPKKRSRALRKDEVLEQAAEPLAPSAAGADAVDAQVPTRGPGADLIAQGVGAREAAQPTETVQEPVYRQPRRAEPELETLRRTGPVEDERPRDPAPAPRRAADSGAVHVVAAGDTLSEISLKRLGTSKRWKEIVDLNPGLDPGRMRVGARLRLPEGATNAPTSSRPAAARNEPVGEGRTYVVRQGDSLWKIALATLGDGERWREIRDANPSVDANRLAVGQRLALPAGARVIAPAAAADAPTVAKADTSSRGKVR